MFQPKNSPPHKGKKAAGGALKGLKKAAPVPSNQTKVVKQSTTDDPIRGLKMALKAAQADKLAEQVAELSSGTL